MQPVLALLRAVAVLRAGPLQIVAAVQSNETAAWADRGRDKARRVLGL